MVQPYPGTYIYQHCINKGLIKDKLDFIKKIGFVHEKAAVNMTNYMTDEEIGELEKEMNTHIGRYSNFVTPLRKKRIGKKTYSFTVKCPFCKKIIKYGNFYVKHPLYYGGEVACKNCYKTFYLSGIIYMTGFKYYGIIKNPFNKLKRVVNAVRKNIIKGS